MDIKEVIEELPHFHKDRVINTKYLYEGEVRIWDGKVLRCQHNARKTLCKTCKGSCICDHNKVKSRCKICGGSAYCSHDKLKNLCRKCKGSSICEHSKQKSHCRICKGASICEHGKQKNNCLLCGGKGICEHKRQKSQCRECKGGSICEHDRQKRTCKICQGSAICRHNKRKEFCSVCDFSKHPKNWCQLCNQVRCGDYKPYCFPCYCHLNPDLEIPRRHLMKENYIHKFLTDNLLVELVHNQRTGGCSKRRPDWYIDCLTHVIIIECDEDQHQDYSCENKRMMELFIDFNNRPIVFIRFNPDKCEYRNDVCFYYDSSNKIQENKKEWSYRSKILLENVLKYIGGIPVKEMTVEKLFYNEEVEKKKVKEEKKDDESEDEDEEINEELEEIEENNNVNYLNNIDSKSEENV